MRSRSSNSSGSLRLLAIATAVWSVVIFAAILIIPSFINWSEQKDKFSEFVKIATGYRLSIGGELDLRMIPRPRVEAADIILLDERGNPVARIDHASAKVRLWPLFFGRVQVTDLVLENPELNISAADILLAGKSSRAGDVGLRNITILNGRIRHGQSTSTDEEQPGAPLSGFPHIEIVFEKERQALSIAGEAIIQGVPVQLDIVRGPFATGEEGATAPLSANLRWYQSNTVGRFRGRLREGEIESDTPAAIIGQASLSGGDWSAFLTEISRVDPLPPSRLRFSMSAQIEPMPDGLALNELSLDLSGEKLNGSGVLGFVPAPSLAIVLTARRFSLDKVFTGYRAGGDFPSPPDWMEVSVKASSRRVEWLGDHLRNAVLDFAFHEGTVTLKELSAKLPGSSDVQISGQAVHAPTGWSFTGKGRLASLSMPRFADWTGLVPTAFRGTIGLRALRRLQASFKLSASQGRISLNDLKAKLGDMSFTGDLAVQPSDSPVLSVTGTLDRLTLPDPDTIQRYLLDPGLMNALDVQAKLFIGEVILTDFRAQDVSTDIAIGKGQLILDPLSIADLEDAAVQGKLVMTPGTDNVFQNFEGSVLADDAKGLVGVFGYADWWPENAPIPLEGDFVSSQSADEQQLIFSGKLGGGAAAIQLTNDTKGKLSLSFDGTKIRRDIIALLLKTSPLSALEDMASSLAVRHIDGSLTRDQKQSVLLLNLGDKDLSVHAKLTRNEAGHNTSLRGEFSLTADKPGTLYSPLPGNCPLSLKGEVDIQPEQVTVKDTSLNCGSLQTVLNAQLNTAKTRPTLALNVVEIDLSSVPWELWRGWKNVVDALDQEFANVHLLTKLFNTSAPSPFSTMDLTADLKHGALQFSLHNPAKQQQWGVAGTLLLAGASPRMDADFTLNEMSSDHLGMFLLNPETTPVEDTHVTASGHLVLTGESPEAWRSGLTSTFNLSLEGGRFGPGALPRALRPKQPDQTVPLTRAQGTVRLSGRNVRLQEFTASFAGKAIHLTGQIAGETQGTSALAKIIGPEGKNRFYRVFDLLTRPVWEDFVLVAAPAPAPSE